MKIIKWMILSIIMALAFYQTPDIEKGLTESKEEKLRNGHTRLL